MEICKVIVVQKTKHLIELLGDYDTFENIRMNSENQEVFCTFLNYYLVHLTGLVNWRYKAYNTCISDIFTKTDTALAILLFKKNTEDLKKW